MLESFTKPPLVIRRDSRGVTVHSFRRSRGLTDRRMDEDTKDTWKTNSSRGNRNRTNG